MSNSVEGAVERETYDCFVLVAVTTWRVSRARVFERLVLSYRRGHSLCRWNITDRHIACEQAVESLQS